MMYAQRFADGPRFRPTSLAAALAINGGVVAALLLAAPEFVPTIDTPPLVIFTPTPEYTPPPDPEPTSDQRKPTTQPTAAPTPMPTAAATPDGSRDLGLSPGPITGGTGDGGVGTGTSTDIRPVDPPLPALIGATFDPRYAADQEPPYPDSLRDAGIQGVVRLRLTIGPDGRVRQAVPLSGNVQLSRIAVRHVLARWRFRPATRGGVPEESTQVMSVRFRLDS